MTDDTSNSVREQARPADPRAVGFADPAPLGLAGLAMTTVLLSVLNTGLIREPAAILPVLGLAAFYGGLAQFVAGLFEYRRGNTFGATLFASYGAFWLTYWWLVPRVAIADAHNGLGLFLLAWGVFTTYMAVAALRTSLAVLAMLVLLAITFVLLAVGEFQGGPEPHVITRVGGWFGIAAGLAAWYASAAAVINASHRRTLLPTWPR
jgi:succinate-acetate transporter protein